MKKNEEIEMTIKEFFELSQKEGGEYQIQTPDGWQDVGFLVLNKSKECYNIITENGLELGCSSSHKLLTEEKTWKEVEEIDVRSDRIETINGIEDIVAKEYLGYKETYDLHVNSSQNRYYSNGIVSHNCGKSLCAKAVANLYQMPLLRLDMGRLFGSLLGQSEAQSRDALKLAEVIQPTILWLDEIEKGLSGGKSSGQTDGGTANRVISTFLTWMQEKTAQVFVFATANDYTQIPPEFMRRFDEVFFVDLPLFHERKAIFKALLRRYKRDYKDFDLECLAVNSENYSGADIEKAIVSALFKGFSESSRQITTNDIVFALQSIKSLYSMRKDEVDEMREWGTKSCTLANRKEDNKKSKSIAFSEEKNLEI